MTDKERLEKFKEIYGNGGEQMRLLGNYHEAAERFLRPFMAVILGPDEAKANAAIELLAKSIPEEKDAP